MCAILRPRAPDHTPPRRTALTETARIAENAALLDDLFRQAGPRSMPADPAMRGRAASRPRPVTGAGMSGGGTGAGSGDGQGGRVSRPLYRLSVQIIGRGRGGNAVAAAAYRSRSRLHDRDRDRSFCFADSDDLVHRSILAPDDAPAWARDREDLWNAVEAAETRCDSTLAREVLVALPRGPDAREAVQLVRGFAAEQFVSRGMVADIAVHDTGNQPHAHILLTTREIGSDGFGLKVREWNDKRVLHDWRRAWAHHLNAALAERHGRWPDPWEQVSEKRLVVQAREAIDRARTAAGRGDRERLVREAGLAREMNREAGAHLSVGDRRALARGESNGRITRQQVVEGRRRDIEEAARAWTRRTLEALQQERTRERETEDRQRRAEAERHRRPLEAARDHLAAVENWTDGLGSRLAGLEQERSWNYSERLRIADEGSRRWFGGGRVPRQLEDRAREVIAEIARIRNWHDEAVEAMHPEERASSATDLSGPERFDVSARWARRQAEDRLRHVARAAGAEICAAIGIDPAWSRGRTHEEAREAERQARRDAREREETERGARRQEARDREAARRETLGPEGRAREDAERADAERRRKIARERDGGDWGWGL